jgi:lysophospholipid acyltransferase (LPLAT)-like uncharacterized protein
MRTRERLAVTLTGYLAPPLFRGLYSSLRFEVSGEEHLDIWRSGRAVVFVTWHGRILPLLYHFRGQGIVALVSQHRDGEYLTRLGRGLGYQAVRGSSTRGGSEALRALVRHLRRGDSLAITPDGPQGPREVLKPGALQAARVAGAAVIPVLAGGSAWWVEGWDSFMIPKPFATIRVAVGEPRFVPREGGVRGLETQARALEEEMGRLKESVDV